MSKRKSTRREFAKEAALLTVAATTTTAAVSADEPRSPAMPASVGQALAAVLRLRYGKYLTEEQFKRVQQRVERNLRSADALRQPRLRNGDEPDFLFLAEML